MKRVFTTIVIVFISTSLFSQSFYRYQGNRIDLRVDSNTFVIQSNNQLVEKQNSAFEEKLQKGEIEFFQKMPNNRFLVRGAKLQLGNYDYFSNVYRNIENGMVIILPRIVVMLKQGGTLQSILDKYEGKLVKESGGNQKYIFRSNVAQSEEVLKLVNELDTRDDVIWCEPEFLSDYITNNTLYPQQYYLKNTGQNGGTAGIDINVEPAWNLTNGNACITVAVIDAGVDRNHEDMGTRVLEGFTIRNATGEGEPQNANSLDSKYHGMACAGIVAASNNTIGIRGVASNVNILPVNIVPDVTYIDGLGRRIEGFGTNIEIAEAISWAWRRADVLSCSWGGGNPSNDITAAIDSARTFGRNGNGSVVVFSSGNYYPDVTDVLYPGRVDGVITVGAITNQGTICNYSQRGTSMDLVAPSGNANSDNNVTTTDRMGDLGYNSGNYMNDFGGTSAACPQVSGVAALMLSVNPNLTEAQVRTILQQTATDMGTSGFDNTYGHGRVNAYAAIIRALGGPITGPSFVCTSGATFSITPPAAFNSIVWIPGPNLTISSGQNTASCTFSATGNGTSWVSARLVTACGNITLPQKNVWAGPPIISNIFGPADICPSCTEPDYYWHYYAVVSGATEYNWNIPGDAVAYNNDVTQSQVGIYFDSWSCCYPACFPDTRNLYFYAGNECEWDIQLFLITMPEWCVNYFLMSPNPASDIVEISITDSTSTEATTYAVSITNIFGIPVHSSKKTGNCFTLPVDNLKDGIYIVQVTNGKSIYSKQLVVKH